MIEPVTAGVIAAVVTTVAGPLLARGAKVWMDRRRHHVRVQLKSGERISLEVGPGSTEEEIETQVRHDERIIAKARES